MSASISRFDWIDQVKEKIKEVTKTGLDFSATSDCIVDIPDGINVETLDQVNLKNLCDILSEEANAALGA